MDAIWSHLALHSQKSTQFECSKQTIFQFVEEKSTPKNAL